MTKEIKKIELSNKIFPLFSGLSTDLLFYTIINTMFLSIVKNFNNSQINSFIMFGVLSIFIFQPLNAKIIEKIGNKNSVKIGVWMLLIASIIITFSTNYYIIMIGYCLHEIAFIFKNMESIILKKNLKVLNKDSDFIYIQGRAAAVYSFATMVTALVAGFLFNINKYLPMYLCIGFCVINIILSNFLYEAKTKEIKQEAEKLKIPKLAILILIVYGLGFSIISIAQPNAKLFIQADMLNVLDVKKTAIYLSMIVLVSRIIRFISCLVFPGIYKKVKNRILIHITLFLSLSMILISLGNIFFNALYGICIMCVGYFLMLMIRDFFQVYMRELLLDNCEEKVQRKAITYFELMKNTGRLLISLTITLILLKHKLDIVFLAFLTLSLIEILISIKLYIIIKSKNN